ncbi:MAG: hypothetical protein HY291_22205 [Planctomycetes bacterium]|nr:hypothetical protein [Planctomycetota bacterium]
MWPFGSKSKRNWVSSSGGPLVLLPRSHIDWWYGADGPPGAKETHYQLACSKGDLICSHIKLENGESVIVLGDNPVDATWEPSKDGGTIIRQICGNSEEDVMAIAKDALNNFSYAGSFDFIFSEGEYVLGDSVNPAVDGDVGDNLKIAIPSGLYKISPFIVETPTTCLNMINFKLLSRNAVPN